VAAVSSAAISVNSAEVSATPQAVVSIAAPTGVTASAAQSLVAGTATATVRWTAATGATSYQVKRATSTAGPWTVVASGLTSTTYSQSVTANNNNVYYYRVDSVGGSGTSADSAAATVSTISPAPANLAATAPSSSQVSLTWTDRSADEQGFKVEYWNGASWVQLGAVGAGVTGVSITGTATHSTYYFRVRAYNGTANTAYSNSVSVTTP
jgi:cellulose 1,4-beta-cellobiosidase